MIFSKNILCTLALTVVFAACTGPKKMAVGTEPIDSHTSSIASRFDKTQRWQLTAINGRDLKPTDDAVTVSFNPEAGTLSGTTACNTYSANYTLQNSELIIQNLQASDLLCPDPAMNAEQRYLGLLRKANRLVVEGTTMTLYSNNREILKFGLQ